MYVEIPDVWPSKFKKFAEIITRRYEKITDHFGINEAAKEAGVKYETAKDYLEILEGHGVVKRSPTLKESYILACTPEEEVQANRESNAGQLAARAFNIVNRTARDLPHVAREILNFQDSFEKVGEYLAPEHSKPPYLPFEPKIFKLHRIRFEDAFKLPNLESLFHSD